MPSWLMPSDPRRWLPHQSPKPAEEAVPRLVPAIIFVPLRKGSILTEVAQQCERLVEPVLLAEKVADQLRRRCAWLIGLQGAHPRCGLGDRLCNLLSKHFLRWLLWRSFRASSKEHVGLQSTLGNAACFHCTSSTNYEAIARCNQQRDCECDEQ